MVSGFFIRYGEDESNDPGWKNTAYKLQLSVDRQTLRYPLNIVIGILVNLKAKILILCAVLYF
jgi:hypothetical protein